MPAPLPDEWERVTWRINRADLDILRAVWGDNLNGAVRSILHLVAERERKRLRATLDPNATRYRR